MVIVIVNVNVIVRVKVIVRVRKPITQILYQIRLLIAAQHQVHALYPGHAFRLQLRIAARHHHEGTWILAHHPVNSLAALVVSHLRHRTGIDQTDIRLLPFFRRAHPHLLQHLPESRSLREIEFASQRIVNCRFALKSTRIYHIPYYIL